MITEKQMKIVDAVNQEKAVIPPVGAVTVWIDHFGSYCFGLYDTNKSVCTIEEYNQCIEEMKYHYDIPKWCSYNRADKELLNVENSDYSFYEKETFVYGQDVYVKGMYKDSIKLKFGCIHVDGERAILFSRFDGVVLYLISEVSSKPFKSKADIELENKENQLDEIMKRHAAKFCRPEQFKSAIKAMQDFGELAKVKRTEEE